MTGTPNREMAIDRDDWRLIHVVHYDHDGPADLSAVVACAVADAVGIDPTELVPPLATVIDLDAIDDLFATRAGCERRVEFTYGPYKVTVRSDDRIRIHEPRGADHTG